jgi:hypothetical protein
VTFTELTTELSARGFSHLSSLRLGYLINRARARLDGMYTWSYREDSASGAAPLSIPTLGIVEAVSNETGGYLLEEMGYADILDITSDITLAGAPQYWYRSTPAGDPVVNTYPDNGDTIGVQFWAITPDISGAEEPASPARYHLLIVDLAQQAAERDRGNHAAAQALQPEIDRQVTEMVEDLLVQQQAKYTRVTWASEDN